MEGQGLRDRAPEFEALDCVILGASFDDPDANRAFAEKYGFPFQLLSATEDVGAAYGALREPGNRVAKRVTYVIDPEGDVARAYEVQDVKTHPDEVLAELRELAGDAT